MRVKFDLCPSGKENSRYETKLLLGLVKSLKLLLGSSGRLKMSAANLNTVFSSMKLSDEHENGGKYVHALSDLGETLYFF